MNQFLSFFLIVLYSIFIGSQITEAILFVPYWQSMQPNEFHAFYNEFGPFIGKFYSILTIIAVAIPIFLSIYCMLIRSRALVYALASSLFSILVVFCFLIYFKGANQEFIQIVLTEVELANKLMIWRNWHWGRIIIEFFALIFLILALINIQSSKLELHENWYKSKAS